MKRIAAAAIVVVALCAAVIAAPSAAFAETDTKSGVPTSEGGIENGDTKSGVPSSTNPGDVVIIDEKDAVVSGPSSDEEDDTKSGVPGGNASAPVVTGSDTRPISTLIAGQRAGAMDQLGDVSAKHVDLDEVKVATTEAKLQVTIRVAGRAGKKATRLFKVRLGNTTITAKVTANAVKVAGVNRISGTVKGKKLVLSAPLSSLPSSLNGMSVEATALHKGKQSTTDTVAHKALRLR